ncbi:hypothetical protein MGN70_003327 [Eutypa lata]|nr:hypothetical protein MGN70_003327 [Eutypa lata]
MDLDNNNPQPSTIEKAEQPDAEVSPRDITGWKWVIATIAILSSIFLYALDGTIVAVIQATIVDEFDSLNDLSWNNVGFLMRATATNMIWGQIYTANSTRNGSTSSTSSSSKLAPPSAARRQT